MSLDSDYRDLRDNTARNPNEELYGPQNGNISGVNLGTSQYQFNRSSWNYGLRLSGTYQLPWGLTYSSSYNGQTGDYFFREVQIRDALSQNIAIRVEPQADRYSWVHLWDNRLTKRITLPYGHSIDAMFDLFNSLNVNTITAQTNRNGQTYLQPTEIISPRVFRLVVRYKF